MTHDELLEKINKWEYDDYKSMGTTSEWPYKIIRSVIELHKPMWDGEYCAACHPDQNGSYPCPTIQAIEKELV